MIQIHIRPENRGGFSAAERVVGGNLGVAKEPSDGIDRGWGSAAAIGAQIQHHVFNGAVFPGDLLMRLYQEADGIIRGRGQLAAGGRGIVIDRRADLEFVHPDK